MCFRDLAMENKPYAADPKLLTSYASIIQAVAQDANGIGYSSFNLAHQTGVKPVAIGNREPKPVSLCPEVASLHQQGQDDRAGTGICPVCSVPARSGNRGANGFYAQTLTAHHIIEIWPSGELCCIVAG